MNAPSAFRIEQALTALLAARKRLLDEDPDLEADQRAFIDTLEGQVEGDAMDVLDSVIRAAIEAESMKEAIAARIQKLHERKARYEHRMAVLRSAAFSALEALGIKSHTRPDFTASIRPGQASVVVTDIDALPSVFVHTKKEADKVAIRVALKNGRVAGAELSNAPAAIQLRTT